jgi:hypothetical protein
LVEISAALPGIDGSWNFLRFLMGWKWFGA